VRERAAYDPDLGHSKVLDKLVTESNIIFPGMPNLNEARERLERDARYDQPAAEKKLVKKIDKRYAEFGITPLHDGMPVNTRELSSVYGAGGEFVPPTFQTELFVDTARASNPLLDLVTVLPVDGYWNDIYIPAVAASYDPVAVNEGSNPLPGITATKTWAATNLHVGLRLYSTVTPISLQLIDRGGLNIDTLLTVDGANGIAEAIAYDMAAGNGVQGTSVVSGQILGYANVAANSSTYTDGSPTPIKLIESIGWGAAAVAAARKRPAEVLCLTPQRLAQLTFAEDSEGDPLQRVGIGSGTSNRSASVQTFIGGLPTYGLAGLQNAVTAGADCALLCRPSEDILFMGTPRYSLFDQGVGANSLTVEFICSVYVAFAIRQPLSSCIVSGTGWNNS